MPVLHFVDQAPSPLGKLERTPQGGYRAPASIARVGVMPYLADAMRAQGIDVPAHIKKGGVVHVYTPPEVLQAAADTLRAGDCPVTDGHPPRMVCPETYDDVVRGNLLGPTVEFDGQFLKAQLAVQSIALIRKVERGESREVSMGYHADTVFEEGVDPSGAAYNAVRRGILYNHTALLARGRAGAQVCLALDSSEIPTEEVCTVKLKINGVEVDASAAQAAIDALEGQLTAARADATTAQATLASVRTELATATSDAAIDAAVKARLDKEAAAAEAAKRLQAVKDAYPQIDLTGKSQVYVDALYDAAAARDAADPDGVARLTGSVGDKQPGVNDAADKPKVQSARQRMVEQNRQAALRASKA